MKILATSETDDLSLLKNGSIAVIGTADELGKRYKSDETCLTIRLVEFDFEANSTRDLFFWENGLLVYYFIALGREAWVRDLLLEAIQNHSSNERKFIRMVTSGYLLKVLGFD